MCIYWLNQGSNTFQRSKNTSFMKKKLDFSEMNPTLSQIHLLLFLFSTYDPPKKTCITWKRSPCHSQSAANNVSLYRNDTLVCSCCKYGALFFFFIVGIYFKIKNAQSKKRKKKHKTGQFQWALWGRKIALEFEKNTMGDDSLFFMNNEAHSIVIWKVFFVFFCIIFYCCIVACMFLHYLTMLS